MQVSIGGKPHWKVSLFTKFSSPLPRHIWKLWLGQCFLPRQRSQSRNDVLLSHQNCHPNHGPFSFTLLRYDFLFLYIIFLPEIKKKCFFLDSLCKTVLDLLFFFFHNRLIRHTLSCPGCRLASVLYKRVQLNQSNSLAAAKSPHFICVPKLQAWYGSREFLSTTRQSCREMYPHASWQLPCSARDCTCLAYKGEGWICSRVTSPSRGHLWRVHHWVGYVISVGWD